MKDEQQMRYYQQPQSKPNTAVLMIGVFGLIFSLINLGLNILIFYFIYEIWDFIFVW